MALHVWRCGEAMNLRTARRDIEERLAGRAPPLPRGNPFRHRCVLGHQSRGSHPHAGAHPRCDGPTPVEAAPPLLDATTLPDGAPTGRDGAPPSLDATTHRSAMSASTQGPSEDGVDDRPGLPTIDAGVDCSAVLSATFDAPIVPPGLDST